MLKVVSLMVVAFFLVPQVSFAAQNDDILSLIEQTSALIELMEKEIAGAQQTASPATTELPGLDQDINTLLVNIFHSFLNVESASNLENILVKENIDLSL